MVDACGGRHGVPERRNAQSVQLRGACGGVTKGMHRCDVVLCLCRADAVLQERQHLLHLNQVSVLRGEETEGAT